MKDNAKTNPFDALFNIKKERSLIANSKKKQKSEEFENSVKTFVDKYLVDLFLSFDQERLPSKTKLFAEVYSTPLGSYFKCYDKENIVTFETSSEYTSDVVSYAVSNYLPNININLDKYSDNPKENDTFHAIFSYNFINQKKSKEENIKITKDANVFVEKFLIPQFESKIKELDDKEYYDLSIACFFNCFGAFFCYQLTKDRKGELVTETSMEPLLYSKEVVIKAASLPYFDNKGKVCSSISDIKNLCERIKGTIHEFGRDFGDSIIITFTLKH